MAFVIFVFIQKVHNLPKYNLIIQIYIIKKDFCFLLLNKHAKLEQI